MKLKDIKKEIEWLRRRLHGHSFDEKTVNLEYVDARIDDIEKLIELEYFKNI